MDIIDIVIGFAVTIVGGLLIMVLGATIDAIYKNKAFAYSTILECLDRGRAMTPAQWAPEKRKAKNLAMLLGNNEVKTIVSDIVDHPSYPLEELQKDVADKLIPAMKNDISRHWWEFWKR